VYEREVDVREAQRAAVEREVLQHVRAQFFRTAIAERRVTVREQLAALATDAVVTSRQLFNTGAADDPDVRASEIEAERAQLSLVQARNDRFRAWRELGLVMGDPALTPQSLDTSVLDGAPPELLREPMLEQMLQDHPELLAARAGVAQADAGLSAAQRLMSPDLLVGGGAEYSRERDEVRGVPKGWAGRVQVGVRLPLWNRNQGGLASARADATRARADIGSVDLELRSRFEAAYAQYLTALRSVEMYRADMLPRAERAYTLYRNSYQQMAAAYPLVLIAQRTLIQLTDDYLDALDTLWTAVAELRALSGD